MQGLLTPLLRRVYWMFAAFLAVYGAVAFWQASTWHKERLYVQLLTGSEADQRSAAFDLAYLHGEAQLLRALRTRSPAVRSLAASSLWDLWARAGGRRAYRQIQAANRAIAQEAFPEALAILSLVTSLYPDFAEGWNRRATLYCRMGRFEEAIADAQKVVLLNPNHFGAWQGMGLCALHLGRLDEACRCIRAALGITPHDRSLRLFLSRCEELLELLAPAERVHRDTV